ncbi:MAG: CPBP family intramembrane metalloprotease [Candidatus Thorarchaeota archaeon]|jgi:membrane protease YdiL (CAAX protease family)
MAEILRTGAGEIRYLWKISLALILTIVLIIISRIVMILAIQQVFVLQGVSSDIAFQNAQVFVSESSEGQAIASSIDLVLILLLVFLLVTRIERREFHLTELGLGLHHNSPLFAGLGLVIGCVLFLGAAMFGVLFGTLEFPLSPNLNQWPIVTTLVASIAFYVLNSFWQEILFRGYLQTRAVEEYGRLIGVIAVAVVFVVFHGLVQSLTPIGILTGILLFSFIGLLYDKTKSLYLVGMIHAVLNFLPVLFNTWWQGLEAILIYGIALALLFLMVHHIEQRAQTNSNKSQLQK